jgi:O-methyltransferase
MSADPSFIDPVILSYLRRVSLREHSVLSQLRDRTRGVARSHMQIAPEAGQLLGFLIKLTGARRVLDVGTFTGYSALAMALEVRENGEVHTFDLTDEWAEICNEHWLAAGCINKIKVHRGEAVNTLKAISLEGGKATFDLAFIDADKLNYLAYYTECLSLVRSGGLIVIDNVFWRGRVADPAVDDDTTEALRKFNDILLHDQRVDVCMIPLGDGMTLARIR